jgi:hypothetical protein
MTARSAGINLRAARFRCILDGQHGLKLVPDSAADMVTLSDTPPLTSRVF